MDGCSEVLHRSSPVPGEDDVVLHYRTTDEPRYSVEVVVLHVVDPGVYTKDHHSIRHPTSTGSVCLVRSARYVPVNNRMIDIGASGTVHPSTRYDTW